MTTGPGTAWCDQDCRALITWVVSIAVPALAGLVGVVIGAWLTGRRERRQRRLAFVETQLRDFYSPMLGLRNEIRMRSELRVQLHETADAVWRELCAQARERGVEDLGDLSATRGDRKSTRLNSSHS